MAHPFIFAVKQYIINIQLSGEQQNTLYSYPSTNICGNVFFPLFRCIYSFASLPRRGHHAALPPAPTNEQLTHPQPHPPYQNPLFSLQKCLVFSFVVFWPYSCTWATLQTTTQDIDLPGELRIQMSNILLHVGPCFGNGKCDGLLTESTSLQELESRFRHHNRLSIYHVSAYCQFWWNLDKFQVSTACRIWVHLLIHTK